MDAISGLKISFGFIIGILVIDYVTKYFKKKK